MSPDQWDTLYEAAGDAAARVSRTWYGTIRADEIAPAIMDTYLASEAAAERMHAALTSDRPTALRALARRAEAIARRVDADRRLGPAAATYQPIDVWCLLESGYLLPTEEQGQQPKAHRDYRNPDSVSLADKADLARGFRRLSAEHQLALGALYRWPDQRRRHARVPWARVTEAVSALTAAMNTNH
ncbi:hypothetical protein [Streptomyces cacaoi]|uniref:Uncharacterized protein n=1 Tax=Streptomyces cacaoi TaxID=1898 RepID=A0A4Y3QYR8_STRCI|nr:hypothetical protein [Streptomyces cacaoi]GEB50401.1 hypothetical protein SCA03_29520 [Streptomyces cacaoi]